MVTNLTPTTISTPPPGAGSGFTMDQSAMETLQQQADDLRAGYQEVSSKLSGQTLAGNAFGTVGTFAAEAFNASSRRSVEVVAKAASTLGLVGEGVKATAQTHLEADRANGEQFTGIDPTETSGTLPGASGGDGGSGGGSGNGGGAPTSQGPQTTPDPGVTGQPGPAPDPSATGQPGATGQSGATGQFGSTGQTGATGQTGGAPTADVPTPDPYTGQAGASSGQTPPTTGPSGGPTSTGGAPTDQTGTAQTADARTSPTPAPVPEFPEIPDPPPVPSGSASGGSTPSATSVPTPNGSTGGGSAGGGSTPSPAPIPDFPEIPDPPPVPSGSAGGAVTPPATPPIPEVPKDLFKQPPVSDLGAVGGGTSGGGGASGSTGGGGSTPSPAPIPDFPEIPDPPPVPSGSAGGGSTTPGSGMTPDTLLPGDQSGDDKGDPGDREHEGREHPGREHGGREQEGRDREGRDHQGRDHEGRDHQGRDHEGRDDEGRDQEGGAGGGGGGGEAGRERHGFPVTTVDERPHLDLRDLPAEEGERWLENIRDILATKGDGSFFWAGDTIDAEGQRHSLMDLAEFMTNLDGRDRADSDSADQPTPEISDTVTASPARSASGDVYVLVGPNHAEDDPVELADFPTLQANPRVERVFAIDAVTGRETQIHPKVS